MKLFPNPGALPTKPTPSAGKSIEIEVSGYPPYKDRKFSIRNPKHKHYQRFVDLRETAINSMAGRQWSDDAIKLDLVLFSPELEPNLEIKDYLSGIFDTLDGSHGQYFTYLPIVYQDDCQISSSSCVHKKSDSTFYQVFITFLGGNEHQTTRSLTIINE